MPFVQSTDLYFDRREFLQRSATGLGVGYGMIQACRAAAGPPEGLDLLGLKWRKDPGNPIHPPDPDSLYERTSCRTPSIVDRDGERWMYYASGGADRRVRICLAIAPLDQPTRFERKGLVLDVGGPDDFDASWIVGPRVCRMNDTWYMYYSALPSGAWATAGLQSISGIGLATSEDGIHWEKYGHGPIITGNQTPEYPENRGIGGGGEPVRVDHPDGTHHYRLYYSLAVGKPSEDRKVSQEKLCAVCHSTDGLHWDDHRIVMRRREEISREDIAANAPVVWRDGELFRCYYNCIGTRWGYYSLAEAVSRDGYDWYRGEGGDDNLVLAPTGDDSWEGEMVCYPRVVREGHQMRLYYCGNRYGGTGIGTAVADLPPPHT